MGRKIFMKYVCLGYLEPRKFEKAGGGGLVRTGFSSLGRIVMRVQPVGATPSSTLIRR